MDAGSLISTFDFELHSLASIFVNSVLRSQAHRLDLRRSSACFAFIFAGKAIAITISTGRLRVGLDVPWLCFQRFILFSAISFAHTALF